MNTEYIIFFTILFLLNIFLAFNFDKYSNFFKIVDKPDDLRKLHKKDTKVFGGTIILLNLLFTMIFFLIFDYDLIDQIFDDKKKLIIFAFTVLLIFLTGIYDDWINLPPINKTIILILVLSISLYLDKNLITDINISFYKIIFLNKFAIFFTIFCYLVFMNAFNMLDGINLQTGFYSIFLTIFLIINDFAYSDIYFNEEKPPSLLNSDPQFDHTVELYSLTKGYSMAGWRVGFAVGNESAISSLTKLKSYIDYGTFQPIQIASTVAINELDDYPKEVSSIYQDRKILAEEYLTKYGFEVYKSTATMFLWAKLPEVYKNDSMKFSIDLLSKSNVAVSPGVGFGNCGEGHIRLALVENKQRIRQAMKNFAKVIDSV